MSSGGHRLTAIERAFQLADRGMENVEIKRVLSREGYDGHQITGQRLLKQLTARRKAARIDAGGDRQ